MYSCKQLAFQHYIRKADFITNSQGFSDIFYYAELLLGSLIVRSKYHASPIALNTCVSTYLHILRLNPNLINTSSGFKYLLALKFNSGLIIELQEIQFGESFLPQANIP